MVIFKYTFTFITFIILTLNICGRAEGFTDTEHVYRAKESGTTLPPLGYLQYCAQYPEECLRQNAITREITLDADKYRFLKATNRKINRQIVAVTDSDLYGVPELWTYPVSRGDCEDFVLLKRKTLIRVGWPKNQLLITVVMKSNGEAHAVLTAVTDHGDLILDNLTDDVKPWTATNYKFIKRQSVNDHTLWVSLDHAAKPDPRLRT